jgi:hypothetical protein
MLPSELRATLRLVARIVQNRRVRQAQRGRTMPCNCAIRHALATADLLDFGGLTSFVAGEGTRNVRGTTLRVGPVSGVPDRPRQRGLRGSKIAQGSVLIEN